MKDKILEDRLKSEAAGQSPQFSAALHERIMNRLANPPAIESHPRLPWRWQILPTAIAAAALLAAGTWIFVRHLNAIRVAPHPEIAIRTVPSVPAISNPVQALDGPIVTEWTTARYAYLDRDGEKLLGYVGRQLDFMPQKR